MSDALVKQALAELQDDVRCRCHPAYKDRGLHDPDCNCDSAEAVQVVADRIEEFEAKLAQALEALELADAALSGANMNMRVVERKVKAAIAELKGDQ